MLDPDLFLAQLKKPEVMRGGASTEFSAEAPGLFEYLKGLSDLNRKAAEVLMQISCKAIGRTFLCNMLRSLRTP